MTRLHRVIARDYRRNVRRPVIGCFLSFAAAGAALGLIALVLVGTVR